ncbi:MAG TPA: hypothetical protein PLB25_19370, partial [Rhodoferax sp.]|nr:hypothetical protein [Rhodoferax sp.]
ASQLLGAKRGVIPDHILTPKITVIDNGSAIAKPMNEPVSLHIPGLCHYRCPSFFSAAKWSPVRLPKVGAG